MNAEKIKKIALRWTMIVLISILIGVVMKIVFGGFHHFNAKGIKLMIIISLGIGIPMWQGNLLINHLVGKRIGWNQNPGKAFRLKLLFSGIYNTIALFFITTFIFWYFYADFSFQKYLQSIMLNTLLVSIISFMIWGFFLLHYFMKSFKEHIKEQEKYKRDIVVYQYEMLKNQVNPHFLFNSLNVLTSLVESDSKAAVKFIRKLAEVYRYVLDAKDKELVPLSEELHLTESYIFMQKNRFGESLRVEIGPMPSNRQIVPIALQMLVENAIKHNSVTSDAPLTVSIYADGDYLVCENNLNPKKSVEDSSTIGLKNIKERYAYLTSIPMEYGAANGRFTVRLPLLSGL